MRLIPTVGISFAVRHIDKANAVIDFGALEDEFSDVIVDDKVKDLIDRTHEPGDCPGQAEMAKFKLVISTKFKNLVMQPSVTLFDILGIMGGFLSLAYYVIGLPAYKLNHLKFSRALKQACKHGYLPETVINSDGTIQFDKANEIIDGIDKMRQRKVMIEQAEGRGLRKMITSRFHRETTNGRTSEQDKVQVIEIPARQEAQLQISTKDTAPSPQASEQVAESPIAAEHTMLELVHRRPPIVRKLSNSWLVRGQKPTTSLKERAKSWKQGFERALENVSFQRMHQFHDIPNSDSPASAQFVDGRPTQAVDLQPTAPALVQRSLSEADFEDTRYRSSPPSPNFSGDTESNNSPPPEGNPCTSRNCSDLRVFRFLTF